MHYGPPWNNKMDLTIRGYFTCCVTSFHNATVYCYWMPTNNWHHKDWPISNNIDNFLSSPLNEQYLPKIGASHLIWASYIKSRVKTVTDSSQAFAPHSQQEMIHMWLNKLFIFTQWRRRWSEGLFSVRFISRPLQIFIKLAPNHDGRCRTSGHTCYLRMK